MNKKHYGSVLSEIEFEENIYEQQIDNDIIMNNITTDVVANW